MRVGVRVNVTLRAGFAWRPQLQKRLLIIVPSPGLGYAVRDKIRATLARCYLRLGLNRRNLDRRTLFGRTFNSRLFSKWSQGTVTYFLFWTCFGHEFKKASTGQRRKSVDPKH